MSDIPQAAAARRAELYAPLPKDSRWMYGLVSSSVALLAVLVVGWFYQVPVIDNLFVLLIGLTLAFGAGLALRARRARQHKAAVYAESQVRDEPA